MEGVVRIEAFEEAFIQLQDTLTSYLFRLTANRQDAQDLAQSTYLKAVKNLSDFNGTSTLKTWIFSIATNLTRDHFRVQRRWKEDTQDHCRTATQAAPDKVAVMRHLVAQAPVEAYEFQEHIDYCFTCLAKTLDIEQQLALILKEIYQFKIAEIMEILNLSEGRVKHALADARRLMTDIFDRRCALVNKTGMCHQCSEINGFVNPKQEARAALMRLKLAQAAEQGTSKERLFDLRATLVRHIDPLYAPGAALHGYLLELMADTVDAES